MYLVLLIETTYMIVGITVMKIASTKLNSIESPTKLNPCLTRKRRKMNL